MQSQSGVATDYNPGSQIRTTGEALGSIVEIQAVSEQAMAFQAMVYGAYAAFGITPLGATGAVGTVTFATSFKPNPPVTSQAVSIPAGTIVQTVSGIQFTTTVNAVLNQGSTSVNIPVTAAITGVAGNVSAGTITQLVSSLTYPLQVSNFAPSTGGGNAETPAETLSRFTAKIASLGLSSPVSIANAVIGVTNPGTTETVKFSTVYEPWIVTLASGAGFDVYIDNGSGGASAGLISAVVSLLNGDLSAGELGYRPAGVPYNVYAVSPVYASVVVSGSLLYSSFVSAATTAAQLAVQQYFGALAFGQTAYQSSITAAISNAVGGYLTNLSVTLLQGTTSVTSVSGTAIQRVILQNNTVNFS
jgi:hypothetical protein